MRIAINWFDCTWKYEIFFCTFFSFESFNRSHSRSNVFNAILHSFRCKLIFASNLLTIRNDFFFPDELQQSMSWWSGKNANRIGNYFLLLFFKYFLSHVLIQICLPWSDDRYKSFCGKVKSIVKFYWWQKCKKRNGKYKKEKHKKKENNIAWKRTVEDANRVIANIVGTYLRI